MGRGIYFCPCQCVGPGHFVVLFLSPQLLLQYLMQRFETCNTAQVCTEHEHNGNNFDSGHYCRIMSPGINIYLTISHCTTVHVSATSAVFDAGI